MIRYTFDQELIEIEESQNRDDISVSIKIKQPDMLLRCKELRSSFDKDKEYTDVMFYTHQDGTYEVIVRQLHYVDFFLQAFRYRVITSLSWDK